MPLVIRAATRYEDALCPAIQRFKYMGRKSLALSLGLLLREAWMRYPELHEVQGYVPVPLHARNERVRGYNQADLLAKALAAYTGRPVLNLLQRVRQTKAQVSLAKAQRQCNIVGAFCLREEAFAQLTRLQKRPLLLIDDVCTTSSTLAECGLTLRRAGIKRVHALVLARDL